MNIDGLGPETVDMFYRLGLIHNTDVYKRQVLVMALIVAFLVLAAQYESWTLSLIHI